MMILIRIGYFLGWARWEETQYSSDLKCLKITIEQDFLRSPNTYLATLPAYGIRFLSDLLILSKCLFDLNVSILG